MPETIPCPHCSAANAAGSAFCESCGKALPALEPSSPRLVTEDRAPTTTAGQELLSQELQKHLRRASGALLAVAIMQTIFGLIIVGVAQANAPPGEGLPPVVYVTIFGVAVVFYGLFIWARRSPLPAAIAGLIVFVTLHLIDAIADPKQIARGFIIKIIIIAILAQAIQAGVRHKRLLLQRRPLA